MCDVGTKCIVLLSSLERLFFERICVCTGDDEFYKAGVDGGRKGLLIGGGETSFVGRGSAAALRQEKNSCAQRTTRVDNYIFAAKNETQQFRRTYIIPFYVYVADAEWPRHIVCRMYNMHNNINIYIYVTME